MPTERELFMQHPIVIKPLIEMNTPNVPLKIYQGIVTLKYDKYDFIADAEICFNWFPYNRVLVKGNIISRPEGLIDLSGAIKPFEIFIEGEKFGNSYISLGFLTGPTNYFEGSVSKSVRGDKTVLIEKVKFTLPNMKQLGGDWIRTDTQGYPGRICLRGGDYNIVLDQNPDFKELKRKLNETGGYIFTYTGEIQANRKRLSFDEVEDIMFSLSIFLGFVNGSSTCPLFWEGTLNNNHVWTHYDSYKVSPYNYTYIQSWADYNSYQYIPNIWKAFTKLWSTPDSKYVLTYAIRWYLEANTGNIYGESRTMIIQAALELICNWFLAETKRIVVGKDADNISAAGKLRILLSYLKIDSAIPVKYSALLAEAKQYNYEDGPDAFVQIRNTIVHSQAKKRERLSKIDEEAKWQALQLGLWYLELALLAILNHDGYYENRADRTTQLVPWSSQT